MMTPCKKYTDHISAYSDGDLSDPGLTLELEQHLETCSGCTEYLNFLKSVQAEGKNRSGNLPSANPFLYGNLSDRLDQVQQKRRTNQVVWPVAIAATVLLAIIPFLPFSERETETGPVTVTQKNNSGILIRSLTSADLFQFWLSGKVPASGDQQRQIEFAVNQSGEPSVVIHERSLEQVSGRSIPSENPLVPVVFSYLDSTKALYSKEISESVVIDGSGSLLINPDIFRIQQELHNEISAQVGEAQTDQLKKEWLALVQPIGNKAVTNLVINLPGKADKVQDRSTGRLYAVVPVDEMTVRGMRLAFPEIPVLRAHHPQVVDTLLYAVIENSARLWEPVRQVPVIQAPKQGKISLAEANQYLNALRMGIPVDSSLAIRASNDPEFRKFLATHPELKQYRLNDDRAQDRFHFQVVHFGRP